MAIVSHMERMVFVKKLIATLLLAGFIFGVVGCGSATTGGGSGPAKTTAPPTDKKTP
jgi:hypothetical protein